MAVAAWAGVVLLPAPDALGREGQLAVALLVAVVILFASEGISLPAIGLLIPVYQVVVGGIAVETVTDWMMSNALLFLLGTLMLVAAISARGLDKLIAIFVLTRVGAHAHAVVFGIVLVSALLTGFMSDAAAALLVAPVLGVLAILREVSSRALPNLTKLLIFAVGYGSIVGSPYTPAGGARNVIIMDYLAEISGVEISFVRWCLYTMPYTLVMIVLLSLVLPRLFPPEVDDLTPAIDSLREEVRERPVDLGQWVTLAVFAVTLVLWMTVGRLFGIGIVAVGAAALLLALGVVEWRNYHDDVDWGVLMIYMGAISLGGYAAETGAATWIASSFLTWSEWLGIQGGVPLVGLVALLTAGMTSTMSAGATVSVLGPIVLELSTSTGVPPVMMGLATAMAASFGFMLIVSTPSNAIIYATGHLRARDFLVAGSVTMLLSFVVFFMLLIFYWPFVMAGV